MRRKIIIIFTSLALLMVVGTFVFADTQTEVKELSGQVAFEYYGGYLLKANSGTEYKLVLGPYWYLENLGLKLVNGDKVTVKGVDAGYGLFYVATLKKGAKTYNITDLDRLKDLQNSDGMPYHMPYGMPYGRAYGMPYGRPFGRMR